MSHPIFARRRASIVTGSIATVMALTLSACGGGQEVAPAPATTIAPAALPEPDSTNPASSQESRTDTTASKPAAGQPERPAPDPDRQLAPDFALNLGSGSTFVLSEETRPVFMVFWAEW